MGVTYKLTEEVINFIIASKRENMSLSCRSLSEMASAKYQSKISKSSVNDVLKSANLSSSVGRRSGEALKLKKFIIPQDKKEIIRQDILDKTGTKASEPIPPKPKNKIFTELPPQPVKLGATPSEIKNIIKNIEDLTKPAVPVEKPKELAVQPPVESVSVSEKAVLPPPPVAIPAPSIVERKESFVAPLRTRERKGHLYNGMGFVLLKAAEWEISDKPFLGNLFKKYVKGPWEKDFEKSCSALTILKMLGIEKLDDTFQYRYHALWRLSGFIDQPSFDTIYDWSKYLEDPQNLIMEYMNECRQVFFEVSGIQFTLEDGSKMYTNASMTALLEELETPSTPLALTKTLTSLSRFQISPENITVFHVCANQTEFQTSFWNMICAFENIPNKTIKSIEIMSEGYVKMADFSVVINKKRFFATGIASWQKEFKDLSGPVRYAPKKQFVSDDQKHNFYFTDTKTRWFSERMNFDSDHALRLITFWQENSDEPFWMILTNQHEKNPEHIIAQYLKKWPEFNQSFEEAYYSKDSNMPKPSEEMLVESVWDIFKDFGFKLHSYVQRHFQSENIPKFGINDYISDIYSLPGYLIENDKNLVVILSLPPSFKYYKDLLVTIKKVNQADILTHDQRNIHIEIDY